MTVDIEPIEAGSQFWIRISLDGGEPMQRGPFVNAEESEAMAARMAGVCRAMRAEVHLHTGGAAAAARR